MKKVTEIFLCRVHGCFLQNVLKIFVDIIQLQYPSVPETSATLLYVHKTVDGETQASFENDSIILSVQHGVRTELSIAAFQTRNDHLNCPHMKIPCSQERLCWVFLSECRPIVGCTGLQKWSCFHRTFFGYFTNANGAYWHSFARENFEKLLPHFDVSASETAWSPQASQLWREKDNICHSQQTCLQCASRALKSGIWLWRNERKRQCWNLQWLSEARRSCSHVLLCS